MAMSKEKEQMLKEKEKLESYIKALNEKNKSLHFHIQDVKKRNGNLEQEKSQVQKALDVQMDLFGKEQSLREKTEHDLRQKQEDCDQMKRELQVLMKNTWKFRALCLNCYNCSRWKNL